MAGRPQERSCGFFVFCGKLRFSLLKRQESATIKISIEQGKVLNEELKHRVRETIADAKETTARQRMEKLQEQVKQLSKEELEALKDLIAQQENTTTDEE